VVKAHDLEGADALLPQMKADILLAIKPSASMDASSNRSWRRAKPQ